MAVQGCLKGIADLVAEEAVYHDKSYCTLYDVHTRLAQVLVCIISPRLCFQKSERYVDNSKEKTYYMLCAWLDREMECGIFTVSQLHK